jgi:hypothetical protein
MIRCFVIVAEFDDRGDLDVRLPDEELVCEALAQGAADDALGDVAGCPVTLHCVGPFPEHLGGVEPSPTLFEEPDDQDRAYSEEETDNAQASNYY